MDVQHRLKHTLGLPENRPQIMQLLQDGCPHRTALPEARCRPFAFLDARRGTCLKALRDLQPEQRRIAMHYAEDIGLFPDALQFSMKGRA